MATTHYSQSLLGSLDTAIAGTSLNALANGGYALGAAINNIPVDGSTISYDMCDLTITLSSSVTTGHLILLFGFCLLLMERIIPRRQELVRERRLFRYRLILLLLLV
jgi:hypothetical protein